MGIETTKALQARRRESAAQIERLIAQADERSPMSLVRRARIKEAARLARRRTRALGAAQRSVAAIEIEIGLALLRLVGDGMSKNEAFELVGLSRHLGRRCVDLALSAQHPVAPGFSTGSAGANHPGADKGDGERRGAHPAATPTGRNF